MRSARLFRLARSSHPSLIDRVAQSRSFRRLQCTHHVQVAQSRVPVGRPASRCDPVNMLELHADSIFFLAHLHTRTKSRIMRVDAGDVPCLAFSPFTPTVTSRLDDGARPDTHADRRRPALHFLNFTLPNSLTRVHGSRIPVRSCVQARSRNTLSHSSRSIHSPAQAKHRE